MIRLKAQKSQENSQNVIKKPKFLRISVHSLKVINHGENFVGFSVDFCRFDLILI